MSVNYTMRRARLALRGHRQAIIRVPGSNILLAWTRSFSFLLLGPFTFFPLQVILAQDEQQRQA